MIQLLKYSCFHWSIAKNVLSAPIPILEADGMEAMDPALGVEYADANNRSDYRLTSLSGRWCLHYKHEKDQPVEMPAGGF